MKKPKVSIIIRTKNEERWISSCLRAVLDQSYKDFDGIGEEITLVFLPGTTQRISEPQTCGGRYLSNSIKKRDFLLQLRHRLEFGDENCRISL